MIKKLIISLLILLAPASAWCFGVGTVGVLGSGAVASGDGPNVWYYPTSGSDSAFTLTTESSWHFLSYNYGSSITPVSSGNVTKLSAQLKIDSGSDGYKIGLYNSSNGLLAQCSGTVNSASPTWYECTVDVAVTGGTSYRVLASGQSDSVFINYFLGGSGIYGTCHYGDAMCDPPTAVGTEAFTYAVKFYVE